MWEIDGNSKVVLEFNKISGWNILPNKSNYQGEYLAGESATNKEFHLMQFTGLKDKDGVDIYEGDIIKGVNGSINCVDWVFEPYVIKWNNDECKFNVPLWGTFDNQDSTHWFEVIGNIHEHKHLLG